MNGKKSFIISNTKSDKEHNQWGLHTSQVENNINDMSGDKVSSGENGSDSVDQTATSLDVIRLVDFFRSYIVNRQIPDALLDSDPAPAVVMKMDIEGEEYNVLQDMMESNGVGDKLLCHVTGFTIEFHALNKGEQKPVIFPDKNKKTKEIIRKIQDYQENINCNVSMVLFDTEEYFNDSVRGRLKLTEWCRHYSTSSTSTSSSTYQSKKMLCSLLSASAASYFRRGNAGGRMRGSSGAVLKRGKSSRWSHR